MIGNYFDNTCVCRVVMDLLGTLLEAGVSHDEVWCTECVPESAIHVKSLIWKVTETEQPVVFVLRQFDKIDYRCAEELIGGKVHLSSSAEASSLSGYPIGNIPPFGHKCVMPVYVDRCVLPSDGDEDKLVYMGKCINGRELSIPLKKFLQFPRITMAKLCETSCAFASHHGEKRKAVSKPDRKLCIPPSIPQNLSSGDAIITTGVFHKIVMKCKSREETPDLYQKIEESLVNGAVDPCECNEAGKNSLHFAAWRGSIDVVNLLLQYVSVDTVSTGCGNYG